MASGTTTTTGAAAANMGIALADVDGDGLPDLFVTHLVDESHTLWKQEPPGLFQDRTAAAGLTSGTGVEPASASSGSSASEASSEAASEPPSESASGVAGEPEASTQAETAPASPIAGG